MIPRQPIDRRLQLRSLFDAAVAAAQPALCLPPHLPTRPKGRTIVIGAGKASAAMARALEDHWDGPLEGLVITRYGHDVPCRHIEIVEAAHPVPDERGYAAARRMLEHTSLSERRACRLAGLSRDAFRHEPVPTPATQALSARLVELARVLPVPLADWTSRRLGLTRSMSRWRSR